MTPSCVHLLIPRLHLNYMMLAHDCRCVYTYQPLACLFASPSKLKPRFKAGSVVDLISASFLSETAAAETARIAAAAPTTQPRRPVIGALVALELPAVDSCRTRGSGPQVSEAVLVSRDLNQRRWSAAEPCNIILRMLNQADLAFSVIAYAVQSYALTEIRSFAIGQLPWWRSANGGEVNGLHLSVEYH